MANLSTNSDNLLNQALEQLDAEETVTLEEVKRFYEQNNGAFSDEYQRMLAKHGPDHPRVKRLEARLSSLPDTLASLDARLRWAKISVPEIDENAWRVHGLILDEHRDPLPRFVVSLFDESNMVKELGFSPSDVNGYYSITVPEPLIQKYKDVSLFLTLSDANGQVYFKAPAPLSLAGGSITYCDLFKSEYPLATPPSGPVTPITKPWIIRGRIVRKEDGQGMKGIKVQLFDKEDRFTNQIKPVVSDVNGAFEIKIETDKYPNLFSEKPGIFLRMTSGSSRQVLSTTENPVFPEAGKEETFEIKI